MANQVKMSAAQAKSFVRRFAVAGMFIALLGGILYSGPHFHEWALLSSILVPIGCGAVGATIGALVGLALVASDDAGPGGGGGPDSLGPFAGLGDSGGAPHDHGSGGGHV